MNFKELKKDQQEKTMFAFLWSAFGITLPFFISGIVIIIFEEYCSFLAFLDNGQFLLFSAALLTSSIYLYRDDENKNLIASKGSTFDRWMSQFSPLVLVLTASSYATIYSFKLFNSEININDGFIRLFSLILFFLTLYGMFRAIMIDYVKTIKLPDIENKSDDDIQDLVEGL